MLPSSTGGRVKSKAEPSQGKRERTFFWRQVNYLLGTYYVLMIVLTGALSHKDNRSIVTNGRGETIDKAKQKTPPKPNL